MMAEQRGEIVIYRTEDGTTTLDVRLEQDSVWLDAHRLAVLFGRDRSVIVKHIRNIFKTKELEPKSTCAKIAQVAKDGKTREMNVYNLDMIIAVGYRVNSKRGTQFRIWATNALQDYPDKGFTLCFPTLYSAGTSTILTLPRQRSNTLALRPGYY